LQAARIGTVGGKGHLATGECAYHYCHIPAGQPVPFTRLITAAGPALTGRGEL